MPEPHSGSGVIYVNQGGFALSGDDGAVLATMLGSCVATCLYDPQARIGGMNHFLLPTRSPGGPTAGEYGVHLMELLINGLMSAGAARHRLRARLFGGANLLNGLSDAGERNVAFALSFLQTERISITSRALRGERGRRIRFRPTSGEASTVWIDSFHESRAAPPTRRVGDVEIF